MVASASAVNGLPPPHTPTIDLHPSTIPPTGFPATGTATANLRVSAPPQTQISHNRMSVTAIVLIVVCTLLGLALCIVIGRFAYRKRLPLLRLPWQTRQVEDSLGFVFVEFDDSTWGTPATGTRKEMPTFEASAREPEGGGAHARVVAPALLASKVDARLVPSVPPYDSKAPPDNNCRELTFAPYVKTGSGSTVKTNEWGDLTVPYDEDKIGVPCKSVIRTTLGLAMGDKLELSTLALSELAAMLALHGGKETSDVLARPGMRDYRPPDASEVEETEPSVADSLSSGLVTCVSSSSEDSSGSEDDYEVHRVETRSMDFKRGIIVSLGAVTDTDGEGDEKPLPRVVISGSSSEVFSSCSNHVSEMSESERTIDLGDFPRPPVISL